MEKDLKYYMSLPYKIEVEEQGESDGGGFILTIPTLGRYSVNAYGDNYEEARENLEEVKASAFKRWIDEGFPIPEPETEQEQEYSGKILLRMPKFIHRTIAINSKENGISINAYINQLISRGLEQDRICVEFSRQLDNFLERFSSIEWPEQHIHHHITPTSTKSKESQLERSWDKWNVG